MTLLSRHVVAVSSGIGSAFLWALVRQEHPDAFGLFADVNGEHPDNYRFLAETHEAIGGRLVKLGNDGRTIWDVFEDHKFLGNTRVAMCSRELKFEASVRWLRGHVDPTETTIHLGIDASEAQRFTGYTDSKGKYHRGQRERWEGAGFACRAPLIERNLDKLHALEWCEQVGILPPLLTRLGFSHANCWGGCVKAGAKQFARLLGVLPDGFAKWETGEERLRSQVGDHAILRDRRGGDVKPLPLQALRDQIEADRCARPTLFDFDDRDACGCFGFDDDEDDRPVLTTDSPRQRAR